MMVADLPPPPPAIHRLEPCPETPNCVSSLAEDPGHRVEPLPLEGTPEEALANLRRIIEEMPGATVDEARDGRIEARFRSRLFGFIDDLVLLVDSDAGVVQVRSASRVGRWDLGVNRRRVESIRSRLRAGG